jgi:hypothetical protein
LQRHTGWIIDRFHLTTCKYQLLYNQAAYTFDWLEERLKALCFHQVLMTQGPGALHAAMGMATKKPPGVRFDNIIQEQNLLRRLASNSILPTIEIEVAGDDVQETADRIADWIECVGANRPPEDEATTRVIYPPVG